MLAIRATENRFMHARVEGGACTITVAYPVTPSAKAETSSVNVPTMVPALNRPALVILAPGTDVVQENEAPWTISPDSALATAENCTCPLVRTLLGSGETVIRSTPGLAESALDVGLSPAEFAAVTR